jgi:hypothetical protein
MRIDSSGRVGIGNPTLDSELVVKGSAHTVFKVKSNDEGTRAFIQTVQASDIRIGSETNHPVSFYQNGTQRMQIDTSGNLDVSAGTVSDSKGNLRSIIRNDESGSSAYDLVAADAGKFIYRSNGNVNIPASTMSEGDAVTIVNNSGSDLSITMAGSVALYNTADANTGTRILAGRGMATILFASDNTAYISGAGLS